jgi:hypothetical protein|tara:strand:+ start:98 stop:364 length:267 start_codon:yes stop_codon:yes gene_type:complete
MYKNILILLIFFGILLIAIELAKDQTNNNDVQIEYRYIPQSFEEEQDNPVYVSDVFKKMFNNNSPWVSSLMDIDREKKEQINQYFITQ